MFLLNWLEIMRIFIITKDLKIQKYNQKSCAQIGKKVTNNV